MSEPEIEYVLSHASPPDPEYLGAGKYRVRGDKRNGKYVQVICIHKSLPQLDFESMTIEELVRLEAFDGQHAYVIHARELTKEEKQQDRRRKH